MKRLSIPASLLLSFALAASATPSLYAAPTPQTAPDNSAHNANGGKTADNQSNARSDRDTAAQIRKAVIADKSLSLYGHNCKIIVKGGQVTLKGPVHSEDEKQKIQQDAASVVDANAISNQLTVKQ